MNKNQNGFATLEIILIIGIIAIFSTVAVPKMARILDKVALDYELKHLYSDLNLARSLGKSSMIEGGIFPNSFDNTGNGQIEFWIYSRNYSNPKNRYQIKRPAVTSSNYYRHNLINGVELEIDKVYNTMEKLTFNNKTRYDNWSKTLKFSSNPKLVNKTTAEVTFDSVGRWRGSYKN